MNEIENSNFVYVSATCFQKRFYKLKKYAPSVGLEPTTTRLRVLRSTI